MAKITAPNKEYTGVSAGVSFLNGKGHTDDPYLISWFRIHGYEVEDIPENKGMEPEDGENPEATESAPEIIETGSETVETAPENKRKSSKKAGA